MTVTDLAASQRGDVVLAPPKRRSYSQLSTYRECPESYYWKYVEKVPEQPSVWGPGGTSFHTLAEQYLRGELGPEPTPNDIDLAWTRAWFLAVEEALERNPDATPDVRKWRAADRGRETAEWWHDAGPRFVRQFIEWWTEGGGRDLQVLEDHTGPYLEREMTVWFGDTEVIAIPDALVVDEFGQVDVLDYKSSRDQAGPSSPMQLGIYKAVTEMAAGYGATWGMFYMTRSSIIQLRDLSGFNPTNVGAMFVDFDSRARRGEYPPRPGSACRFCPFKRELCSVKGKITTTSQEAA